MKITQSNRPIAASRRPGVSGTRSAGAGDAFAAHIEDRQAPAGPLATTGLSRVGAVLSVQEVGDGGGRRRAVARAHRVLDELHELRLAIVGGSPSQASQRRLAGLVEQARPAVDHDRALTEVLEEIELRAAVELAKLQREPS